MLLLWVIAMWNMLVIVYLSSCSEASRIVQNEMTLLVSVKKTAGCGIFQYVDISIFQSSDLKSC